MAYTICDCVGNPKPLRLLMVKNDGDVTVGEPFRPYWWVCDPCNPPRSRYEIDFRFDQDQAQPFRWFEVVTTDDSENDIAAKVEHYRKVIAADKAMAEARREFERLNG